MKKYFSGFLALVLISTSAFSQNKMLTMQDAMLNARTTFATQNLRMLQFVDGSDDYVYLRNANNRDVWMRGNFKGKEEREFLNLSQINERLKANKLDTFKAMPPVMFNNDNYVVSIKGSKYSIDNSGAARMLFDGSYAGRSNMEQSSDGYIAFTDKDNLFIAKDGKVKQITTDGSSDIVYASSVHQSEFGITKGTFWSPDGKVLAFYRMDQTMIKPYPIIDWSDIPAKNENIKYPMAGDSSHWVTLGVYNTQTDKLIYLKTGEPKEQFLTNIAWSPDNKFVYIAIVNRQQNHIWLNQYNAATGDFVKTLFEETDNKYAEPLVPILFLKNNPNQFVWQSRRDGWNHLYIYDTNGKLIKQLTKGNWNVLDVKGFNTKGNELYINTTIQSPIEKDLYSVNLVNNLMKRLTSGSGVHNAIVSSSGNYLIDNSSTINNPRTINLIDLKSGKSKTLLQAANPLADYQTGKLSVYTIKNKSGDDLYCRTFLPVNFDSTKKYPVIVYWYGGPHAQLILNSWNGGAGDYWFQYMAERGYYVFTIDTRGSANRSKAFEQIIHRQTGNPQMEDLMDAVNYLGSLKYADTSRMGLFGWSYGGFMTTNFLLHHPGVFKAGVAGGPVMNWRMYEIMYGERYMDTPQENPEGYKMTNLSEQAGKLKDKLLLIHGMQDPVVLMQHSVNFVRNAITNGVQVDYMIYPGHEHNVIGKDRVHLYQKVTDYLMQYVK